MDRTCSINGCGRSAFCRGWCNPHYLRWLKTGNPESTPIRPLRAGRPPIPIEERFWPKVQKVDGDGCWEWQANRNHDGYGVFRVGGRAGTMYPASKVAYELTNGLVPDGLMVCHRCDNPPCCRPDHLFLGTPKDNVADMDRKGRRGRRVMKEVAHA